MSIKDIEFILFRIICHVIEKIFAVTFELGADWHSDNSVVNHIIKEMPIESLFLLKQTNKEYMIFIKYNMNIRILKPMRRPRLNINPYHFIDVLQPMCYFSIIIEDYEIEEA